VIPKIPAIVQPPEHCPRCGAEVRIETTRFLEDHVLGSLNPLRMVIASARAVCGADCGWLMQAGEDQVPP
jgi:hypothetical protein